MEPQEKEKRETNLYKIDQTEENTAPSIVDYEEFQSDRLANNDPIGADPDPRVSKMAPAPDNLVILEEPNSCKTEVIAFARLNSSDESLQVRRILKVSSKQTKINSVRTEINRNKICFAIVFVCFVRPKRKNFGLFRCLEPIS